MKDLAHAVYFTLAFENEADYGPTSRPERPSPTQDAGWQMSTRFHGSCKMVRLLQGNGSFSFWEFKFKVFLGALPDSVFFKTRNI